MYLETFEKSTCCGCKACLNICPKKCISSSIDEEGFEYPIVDRASCIDCGLCKKVCPTSNSNVGGTDMPQVYAARNCNESQLMNSSSGGVFYEIASFVISSGGYVYGAAFDDSLVLKHIEVDNLEELERLRGSKYIQSDLSDIFITIKKRLTSGALCYFVGTGCQVASLRRFLRKEYSNLITSDLVCHGVPSQRLFDMHKSYLEERHKGHIKNYWFRNNKSWEISESFTIERNGKIDRISNPSYHLSPYLYSFMRGMTYRDSCYSCKFATLPRQGDITLADYWGIEHFFPEFDSSKGVSLVLVNTVVGEKTWEHVKCKFDTLISNVESGAKYNFNLLNHSVKPDIRNHIFRDIHKYGYKEIAETAFKSPLYTKMKLFSLIKNNDYLLTIYKKLRK